MVAGLSAVAGGFGVASAIAGDPNPAMGRPDQVAWELFAQIARDASRIDATPPDRTSNPTRRAPDEATTPAPEDPA